MAYRRMFSKRVINSARFLKMPVSTQCLYFHLGLHADDDGVVEAYTVLSSVGATEDDLRVLVAKGFVVVLNEDLVSYITDWKENNKIRSDRKIDSIYQDMLLSVFPEAQIQEKTERADVKKASGLLPVGKRTTNGQPMDVQWTTNGQPMDGIRKDRVGEDKIGEDSIGEGSIGERAPDKKHRYGEYNHILLKDSERDKLFDEYGEPETLEAIKYLDEYIEMKGTKYKSHYLALRKWVFDALKEKRRRTPTQEDSIVNKWLKAAGEYDG